MPKNKKLIYPKAFEEKIGFVKVRELLKQECLSVMGETYVTDIKFQTHLSDISICLQEVDEFLSILRLESAFPCSDYYDMRQEINAMRLPGNYISLEAVRALRASLSCISDILSYFSAIDEEAYPRLCALSKPIILPTPIIKELNRILNEQGEVKDTASEKLHEIRLAIRKKQGETQKYIRRYLSQAKQGGWVDEQAEFSIRNERLVIPLFASHKRKIHGFIHDVSATGQTVFMEPEEIFNLNNEIVELHNNERNEIVAILKAFSDYVRPWIPELLKAYDYLAWIDFVRAKAKFALKIKAGVPLISDKPCLSWKNARHPLLSLSIESQGKTVVPLDISFHEQEKIMIISGPNAGGKSVCLKTVGLLQYMVQCGLAVPMEETSEVGIFHDIFVDIGDEQSIENDLSTYSSHLKNMKALLENAGNRTLFLADELGTGTEPQLGGAIAEAILEELAEKGSFGVVSTHYANLKILARKYSQIVNAAMLFDNKELKPLYILKKGMPGSSFAFEMAYNIGFPKTVLERAATKTADQHLSFEKELQQIEIEKREIEKLRIECEIADKLLSETIEKYQGLYHELEVKKKLILKDAKEEAKQIIQSSNALIERTIAQIKQVQAKKEETQEIRKNLQQQLKSLSTGEESKPISRPLIKKAQKTESFVLQKNDYVCMLGQKVAGQILDIKGETAYVAFDFMKIHLPLKQLRKFEGKQLPMHAKSGSLYTSTVSSHEDKYKIFSPRIDIRGKRVDEAGELLHKLIDDAVLCGYKNLEVLHGKGNGILRRFIRENLQRIPEVESYHDQSEEAGGCGITMVKLK